MPRRPIAPWVGAGLLLGLLALAGLALRPGGGEDPAPVIERVDDPTGDLPAIDPPDVAPGHCGVVVYTPPRASTDHEADLCRPAGGSARAAIVLVHGGGGYSGDRSTMREWATWYRHHGLVTLSIDYTLVGDGRRSPVYPRPEQDLKAAVQWLRLEARALGFDGERVLVHGSSAGARLAAQALVTADDPWFDGADLWPRVPDAIAGMVGFYGYYDGDTLEAEAYYGGGPHARDRAVRERWARADSVAAAAQATGAVLLFHGDVDGLITLAQTERFGAALAEAGKDVTTFIVTDGDHAFDGRFGDLTTETGRAAAAEIADWLNARFP